MFLLYLTLVVSRVGFTSLCCFLHTSSISRRGEVRLDLGQEKGRSGNIEGKKGKNGRVLRIMGRRGGEESCPKPWWQGENSPARGGRGKTPLPVVAGGKLPCPWWQGENSPARGGRGKLPCPWWQGKTPLPVVAGGKLPCPWWQGENSPARGGRENSPARGGRGKTPLPVVAGGKLPCPWCAGLSRGSSSQE